MTPAPSPVPGPGPDGPLGLTATVVEITEVVGRARIGRPLIVRGTLVTDEGRPATGQTIEILLNETKEHGGRFVGEGEAVDGTFEITIVVPEDIARGSYQALAHAPKNEKYAEAWSDPEIGVFVSPEMELSGPSRVLVGTRAVFSGLIRTESGEPLADRPVIMVVDGTELDVSRTDAEGRFAFHHTFDQPGPHVVVATFGEDDFILGISATLDVLATIATELEINVPRDPRASSPVPVTGRLRTAHGEPVSGKTVVINVDGVLGGEVATTGDGGFGAAADLTDTDVDSISITVAFGGDDLYEPSKASLVLPLGARSQVGVVDWLPWALTPLLIVVVAGGGFVLGRRMLLPSLRPKPTKDAPIDTSGEVAAKDKLDSGGVVVSSPTVQPSMRVQLVKFAADLPAVWGTEEAVELALELTAGNGSPVSGAPVSILIDDLPATSLRTDGAGIGTASVVPGQPGAYRISARFSGDDRYSSAEATEDFRVVVFREEVIGLFNAVRAWSSSRISRYSSDMTPREWEAMVLTSGISLDERALSELVRLFEYADYSEHEVARPGYESMYRACKAMMGDDLH